MVLSHDILTRLHLLMSPSFHTPNLLVLMTSHIIVYPSMNFSRNTYGTEIYICTRWNSVLEELPEIICLLPLAR